MTSCKNCNAQLPDDSAFCTSCGKALNAAPEEPQKNSSKKKIGAIVAISTLVLIVGLITTMAYFSIGPLGNNADPETTQPTAILADIQITTTAPPVTTTTPPVTTAPQQAEVAPPAPVDVTPVYGTSTTIGLALENLMGEVAERISATPFQALGLLVDSLRYGTVNVDVRYGGPFGVRVELTLASDTQNIEYYLQLAATLMGFVRLDAELYVTEDSLAIRIPLFDDNFYGITFSTLLDDLEGFLGLLGIDLYDLADLFDIAEMFDILEMLDLDFDFDPMYLDVDTFELLQPYVNIILDILDGINFTATNTEISGVSATRYEYELAIEDFVTLVNNFIYVFINDEGMRAYFETLEALGAFDEFYAALGGVSLFEELVEELYYAMYEIEFALAGISAGVTLAVYVSHDDYRLMHFYVSGALSYIGEPLVEFVISADFGQSDWLIQMSMFEGGWEIGYIDIIWDYINIVGIHANFIDIDIMGVRAGFMSEWSPSNGYFTLSASEAGATVGLISGQFLVDNNGGFLLRFVEGDLDISITATPGTPNIPSINFVNMDQWDWELIDQVEWFIFDIMMLLGEF